MINFSKEIKLDSKWQKIYYAAKTFLYLIFISGAVYIAYVFLFPSFPFNFFFRNPDSLKNTIVDPRNGGEKSLKSGKLTANQNFLFNANIDGDFSKVKIRFSLENDSPNFNAGTVALRKSFRSFLFPEGSPMGFPSGSLIKNNGNFYIVSNKKLRRFANQQIVADLGFNKDSFSEVSEDELNYNEKDEYINSAIYPDDSLFKINDRYYQLNSETLQEFVSEKAFSTKFNQNQAIEKDNNFLKNYPLSEDLIGFADGTLISSGISIFIVEGSKIYPVADPVTFESMNFSWDDVIAADGEEMSIYEKDKLFTLSKPHINRTIFTTNDQKYYIIDNKSKRELKGQDIIKAYLKNSPIVVDEKSLNTSSMCKITGTSGLLNSYSCEIDLKPFQKIRGNDFEFNADFDSDIRLKSVNVTFEKAANFSNLWLSLSNLKKRTTSNYVGE